MHNKSCPFCAAGGSSFTSRDSTAIAVPDKFPVTVGHMLIIPKRHVQSIFDLQQGEWNDCLELLNKTHQKMMRDDPTVTGFNIGINIGTDAGQTIDHAHIHLIPRRRGDAENPLGGVRNVISGKGEYLSSSKV
jgi:ATP adenylyltransferase